MDLIQDKFILLPFFLTGFFNKDHMKDGDIVILEKKNSLIGSHQSCKIPGYGGLYPPLTVYEHLYTKDYEVDGRTVKDVIFLTPTFKASSLKDDTLPTEELLKAIHDHKHDIIRETFENKPMTYIEGYKNKIGDEENQNLLIWAVKNKDCELVKILCENVCNVDDDDNPEKMTALMWAAKNDETEIVQELIYHRADPFKVNH